MESRSESRSASRSERLLAGLPNLPADPQAKGPIQVEDPPVFPLSAVKPGQKGTGYTVFSSLRGPEPFQFEVLGVMKSFLGPGEDLIIARLYGGEIEKTGVISGMSGSPVYIDGKLVGAVGYRFGAFTKEPIAGITPIERMKQAAPAPSARVAHRSAEPRQVVASAWGQAEPIAVPLSISGVPAHVLEGFRPELDRRGYQAVAQGGGGGASRAPPVRFYPGGPISGNIVDGDVTFGAIGTVTWVKGDRFLAFGHPFMGQGKSDIPVGNAQIVTTVASEAGSWKMGQGLNTFGRLTDDRLHAIAGTMGQVPARARVQLTIDAESPRKGADAQTSFEYLVMQHETDTPMFIAIAIAGSMGSRIAVERGGTVDVSMVAKLSDGSALPMAFRASDVGMGFELPVAFSVLAALTAAVDQDFKEVLIDGVDVKVKTTNAVQRTRIAGVDAPRGLEAGKEAELRVRLASFRGKQIEERRIKVRVPRGTPAGAYTLVVAGATESARVEREIGAVPTPLNFARHIQNIKDSPPPGSLSVFLVSDDATLKLDGQALSGLPASMEGLLAGGGGLSGQVLDARGLLLARTLDGGVVFGEAQSKTFVRDNDESGE
jgi:hypothetical protein